jgi:hypothetical protein
MTGAIDAIRGGQPREAFIREVIERELRRRGARAKKTSKKTGPTRDLARAAVRLW